jgi:hypothetical protein
MKDCEYLGQLNDYKLLKKNSFLWRQLDEYLWELKKIVFEKPTWCREQNLGPAGWLDILESHFVITD